MGEHERSETLADRIKLQFPALFITLLSVLIGLVLADMVAEARTRMTLWPLTLETLRSWGQLCAHGASAVTAWVVFSHIGVSRERTPMFSDSLVAFLVPLTLLMAMDLIGKEEIWPWFYYGSFSLVVCAVTSWWLLRLSFDVPELVRLQNLLQTRGYFAVFYVGIPVYAAAGWLGQNGMLGPVAELILAAIPAPSALLAGYLFQRDWRVAIHGFDVDEASATAGAAKSTAPPIKIG